MARFGFVVSVAACLLCCTFLASAEVTPECKEQVKAKCVDNFKTMCDASSMAGECQTGMDEFTEQNKCFNEVSIIAGMFPEKYSNCRALFNLVDFTFDDVLTKMLNAIESKMGNPCDHIDTIEDVADAELMGKMMDIYACQGEMECTKVKVMDCAQTLYGKYEKNADKLQSMFSQAKDGSTEAGCDFKQHVQDVFMKHQDTMSAMASYTMTNVINNCGTATKVLPAVAGEVQHYACSEPMVMNNLISPMNRHISFYKPKVIGILRDILGNLFDDVVKCGIQVFTA